MGYILQKYMYVIGIQLPRLGIANMALEQTLRDGFSFCVCKLVNMKSETSWYSRILTHKMYVYM